MIVPLDGPTLFAFGGVVGRGELAGSARLELVAGVVQLRPEDAMVEAMLKGWRAQQTSRGLRQSTMDSREKVVRSFLAFTNEYPWNWLPGHVEEWTLSLTSERQLALSSIRGYQTCLVPIPDSTITRHIAADRHTQLVPGDRVARQQRDLIRQQ